MRSAYNATVQYAWEGYPESLASPDTGQNRWEWRSGVIFVGLSIVSRAWIYALSMSVLSVRLLASVIAPELSACGEAGGELQSKGKNTHELLCSLAALPAVAAGCAIVGRFFCFRSVH
jgi:hypothetical protein